MKPILFNTKMVRAILAGRKTVTRRVVKPQPICDSCDMRWSWKNVGWWRDGWNPIETITWKNTPYRPGDILYVRETWQEVYETEVDEDAPCGFVNIRERIRNFDEIPKVEAGISCNCATATMEPRMKYYVFKASDISYAESANGLRWRSPVHMPREAARIFLRVTDVRVERLQGMNMNDIQDEGVVPDGVEGGQWQQWQHDYMKPAWDSTIKPKDRALYGWEANPWVWVIEFERCDKLEEGK